MNDPVIQALLRDVVAPILFGFVLSAGAWIVSKLPGPIRESLASAIHARDVALLRETMRSKATAEVANAETPPPSSADLIRYVEGVLPGLLAKMHLPEPALETIATAAIAKAAIEVAPVAGTIVTKGPGE